MARICFTHFFPNDLQLSRRRKVIQVVCKNLDLQTVNGLPRRQPYDQLSYSDAGGGQYSLSCNTLNILFIVSPQQLVLQIESGTVYNAAVCFSCIPLAVAQLLFTMNR